MLTEQETIDICNKVREAGGANPIQALLPAKPAVAKECVIAKALNFECFVRYESSQEDLNSWYMYTEDETTMEKIEKIFGLGYITWHETSWNEELKQYGTIQKRGVKLPRELAEVALAFDNNGEDRNMHFHDWLIKLAR